MLLMGTADVLGSTRRKTTTRRGTMGSGERRRNGRKRNEWHKKGV